MRGAQLALLGITVAVISCQPPRQEPVSLSEEDVAAIRELAASYRDAALAQDFETLAGLFTPEGIRNVPNAPPSTANPASLQAAYTGVTEFESAPEEIDGRGDLAYARGPYSITVTPEGAAEAVSDTGHYVVIVRRQEDGRWLISYLISNSDQPVPEAEEES